MNRLLMTAAATALVAFAAQAQARDQIRIVGSSTVFPFATAVAEQFGTEVRPEDARWSRAPAPAAASSCSAPASARTPPTSPTRRGGSRSREVDACAKAGVTEITEVKIGFDGIVLANSKSTGPSRSPRRRSGWRWPRKCRSTASSSPIPTRPGARSTRRLPAEKIEVLGPPPTSGTRDAFVELRHGSRPARSSPRSRRCDADAKKAACQTIREDGAYVEAGENDNLIVQKLEANPAALGIFGFSFLDQNIDRLQGSSIQGVEPTFENIADGKYPISRSLYFYVKNAHVGVVPGMREYIAEFTSEAAIGEDGYLADKGLIPLPEDEIARWCVPQANKLTPLTM